MGAGLSEVEIYNMALDLVDEPPAFNITDDRTAVRMMRRNFRKVMNGVLTEGAYHFSYKRAKLSAELAAPAFGWERAFRLPSDCLRLIPLTEGGDFEAEPVPYELESGFILTSASAPLPIRYIRQVQPGELPELVADVVAASLALRSCTKLVGKNSYYDRVASTYNTAQSKAEKVNAVEKGTLERAYDTDFITVREGGLRW